MPPSQRKGATGAKKPRAAETGEGAPRPKKPRAAQDGAPSRPRKEAATAKPAQKRSAKGATAKPARPRKGAAAPRGARLKRWLVLEALTWGAGAVVGLGVAGFFLWVQARTEVADYLKQPRRAVPSAIYSAPIEPRVGQVASAQGLAGELLSGGYEKVQVLTGPDQFTLDGGRFEIWTAAAKLPGTHIDEKLVTLTLSEGRIAQVKPAGARLRPATLATVGDPSDRRAPVQLKALSPWVEPALLAMEDARFRDHSGVDPVGLARALVHNLVSSGDVHGGSTLTQQLAKNLFLSPDRTLQRKVKEAFFAAALEAELSKDQLLELYLGEVYLGQVGGVPLHGVEAASRAWFGVSSASLSLGQAATIAGVISAPNRYSPTRHRERAQERRDLVLGRMVTTKAVTEAQAQKVVQTPLVVGGLLPGAVRRAPWAVDTAVDQAEDALSDGALASWGYQIHTTLQPLLQRIAEQSVRDGLSSLRAAHPDLRGAQAALVAVRVEDGAVLALVGGEDYLTSPFNRATHAWRQAGSTVKPLTLLAAFSADAAMNPLSPVMDEPITRRVDGKTWTPTNYDHRYLGEIPLRVAIEKSRNIPAILLAERYGPDKLQRFCREAGLSRATQLPSAALGAYESTAWELAGAFTAFPGQGMASEPRLIRAMVDSEGALALQPAPRRHRLADEGSAAMATAVLQGVISHGTGRGAASFGVVGPVGGKTGTTDDGRDAWFVGFTPEVVVAVWVGLDRGTLGLAGAEAALPIWARYLRDSGAVSGEFPTPKGIEDREVCLETHQLARHACERTYQERFRKGEVPSQKCELHGAPVVRPGRVLDRLLHRDREEEE
ncbi:MAG: transglycosylase domain-containing protein [Deltaproteobacteria bacterium]|nr:transglycosylase domain-containing protein [Deltaproteobacteria bacterium]